ncbi:aquaporin-like [Agrilus planipennis]|uniref:Aquaporin-like n=1 Tax=Agrilus planipennis TaxID=224129 RepID=A0A1W4W8X8_AGRPL|nr:aquaporin-like [Agrilus planipennis]
MSEGRHFAGMEIKKPTKKKVFVYITLFFSEFFGSCILLIFGCLGCSVYEFVYEPPVQVHLIAFSFGFAAFISLMTFIPISGSHINPQITIAAVILGKLNILRAIVYCLAQFSGAIAGYALLLIVLPGMYRDQHFCVNRMNDNLEVYQALLVEILMTAALIFTCGAVWDAKSAGWMDSVSIRLGLVIAALATVGASLSGASMNTARSFGPALLNNSWKAHWIYWVGPTVGSVFSSVVYRFLFEPFDDSDDTE